jgi:two-component system, cell cycle response regulator
MPILAPIPEMPFMAAAPESLPTAGTAVTATAPRVLIVDDSRIVRATIIKHIKGRFAHVEAADGEEGWARLAADRSIRVVISDLAMPKLDGYGLLQRIRKSDDARIRAMPVVMISGDDETAQMKRASKLGATEFITKGIGAVELVARLENLALLSMVKAERDDAREVAAQTATTDPLTQQGTMALLVKQGAAMFSYARRHRVPLAVVRVRIDDFTAVRTRVGEGVADQILVAVARLLTSRLRKEDVVARTDGAEFSIAAPAASTLAAAKFARRLADDIRGARITWRGKSVRITASIGVSDSAMGGVESFADVFGAAGRRLERASAAGGDRVVAEDAEDPAGVAGGGAPGVEEALALLAAGRGGELHAFAEELALKIYPLVKFCDERFSIAERTRIELAATQKLPTIGNAGGTG